MKIKNFRSIKEETINFDDYIAFVGANGSGKSSILAALNIFFGDPNQTTNTSELDAEDFHKNVTDEAIEITITFSSLTKTEREELKDYVRHDKLIVSAKAVFEKEIGKAKVVQYGARLGIDDFRTFFAKSGDGAKVAELKQEYIKLMEKYKDLPKPGTKDNMVEALQIFEQSNSDKCIEIPSKDQFYGINQSGKLNKYIQWVYIPAVKNASDEQKETKNGAFGKLLARTVRSKVNFDEKIKEIQDEARASYERLLGENQAVLNDVSKGLKNRLSDWAHPGINLKVEWAGDLQKSVQVAMPFAQLKIGEGDFEGQISRLGHGLQRSYIIALLQELASMPVNENLPTLILGCEEPELYQHPPQSRHLSGVFKKISEEGAQVVVTTHSPVFVTGETFANVRICRQDSNRTKVFALDIEKYTTELKKYGTNLRSEKGAKAKLHQVLQQQISEMFFAKKVIFVEGIEDQAFLLSSLSLFDGLDTFRKAGGHIVLVNGKDQLIAPLVISKLMKISSMVMFDADSNAEDKNGNGAKGKHEKDNKAILGIIDLKVDHFPKEHIFSKQAIIWKNNIGDAFIEDCGEQFSAIKTEVEAELGQPGGLEKNVLAIAERIHKARDKKVDLQRLKKMTDAVNEFLSE